MVFHSSKTDRKLLPVLDLDYNLSCAFHTPELLRQELQMLSEHGFDCIHIVAPPDGTANYSPATFLNPACDSIFARSRAAFGDRDPLEWALQCAVQAGLEVIVEFKPYEGGGNLILPRGTRIPEDMAAFDTLGGTAAGVEPFIAEHPEFLLERCPEPPLPPGPITAVEIVFAASGNTEREKFDQETTQIYSSGDNNIYHLYNRSKPQFSCRYETRRLTDANGVPLCGGHPVPCRVMRISNLQIEEPFFALHFPTTPQEELNSFPATMARVCCGGVELPVTVSGCVRNTGTTASTAPVARPPFTVTGFDFAVSSLELVETGLRPMATWGFARGKLQRLRGCLCEAYPQVRKYWLRRIRKFMEMGAAGVDIRLQNHCSGIVDFRHYGFNPPLAEAWQKRYGFALDKNCDPLALMRLRGEFFVRFLEEAAELLHRDNRRLLCQFHGCMEHPSLSAERHETGFWANAKILPDWRRMTEIADEIVIKNYNFGEYRPETADAIKQRAAELGKPLWVHCYLQQGHDWSANFLDQVSQDSRVNGILLYEVIWNAREKDGILNVCDNRIRWMFDSPTPVSGIKS